MKKRYVIVGGGGFGREVASSLEILIAKEGGVLLGFVDDGPNPLRDHAHKYPPLLGSTADFVFSPDVTLLLAVAEPIPKLRLAARIEARGGAFGTFVHPTATIVRTASVGRGCILCSNAGVSADAIVGNFVVLNAHSGVAHDSVVGEGTTISSFVDICGNVKIGREVFIGSHASILPGVHVGDQARIGAGSIVMRDVRPRTTIYQPPAKVLKDHE